MHRQEPFSWKLARLFLATAVFASSCVLPWLATQAPPTPTPQLQDNLPGPESADPTALPSDFVDPGPIIEYPEYEEEPYIPPPPSILDAAPELPEKAQGEPVDLHLFATPGQIAYDGYVTFSAIVTNDSAEALNDLVFVDELENGFSFLPDVNQTVSFDINSNTINFEIIELAPGEQVAFNYTLQVTAPSSSPKGELWVHVAEVNSKDSTVALKASAELWVGQPALQSNIEVARLDKDGGWAETENAAIYIEPNALSNDAIAVISPVAVPSGPDLQFQVELYETENAVDGDYNGLAEQQLAVTDEVSDDLAIPAFMEVEFDALGDLNNLPGGKEPFVTTYIPELDVWVKMPPTLVDYDNNTVTVETDHFSTWGAGIGDSLPQNGANVLLFEQPYTAPFIGSSRYSMSISTPPGRAGMAPGVSISYSSTTVDGLLGDVQAPWVGVGWNMDAIEIVRQIDTDENGYGYVDKFALTFNGALHSLIQDENNPERYHTERASFLYIERHNLALSNALNPPNMAKEWWEVVATDGTRHRLGWTEDSEQLTLMYGYECSTGTPCTTPEAPYDNLGYAGAAQNLVAMRWRVDRVTDTNGNYIEYNYTEEGPAPASEVPDFDLSSYLYSIAYTGNIDGTLPGYKVQFNTEARSGDLNPTDFGIWDHWDTKQLSSIEVYCTACAGLTTTAIRTYDFAYSSPAAPNANGTLVLDSITISGGGFTESSQSVTATTAATVSFTYTNKDNRAVTGGDNSWSYPRLSAIDNGYGASLNYTYTNDGRGTNSWYNWRVSEVSTKSNFNSVESTVAIQKFTYSGAVYTDEGGSGLGELIGYSDVTETSYETDGTTKILDVVHNFGTESLDIGRALWTEVRDPATSEVLRKNTNSYVTDNSAAPFEGWEYRYLSEAKAYMKIGGSLALTSKTVYQHDSATGNLLLKQEYLGTALVRQHAFQYSLNADPAFYIMDRVSNYQIQDATGNKLGEKQYYYDNSLTAPTAGNLTLAQAATGNGVNTVDSSYEYDKYGNVIAVRSYTSYGVFGTSPSGGYHQNSTSYDATFKSYPITATNAQGQRASTKYLYMLGLPYEIEDINDWKSSTTYDGLGRVRSATALGFGSATVKYTYPSLVNGEIPSPYAIKLEIWDTMPAPDTYRSIWGFYDGLGRSVQNQVAGPSKYLVSHIDYNDQGLIEKRSLHEEKIGTSGTYQTPNWAQLDYSSSTYDLLGRLTQVTAPGSITTNTSYNGLTMTVTDPNGEKIVREEDGLGRLVKVQEFDGTTLYATTVYGYDAQNHLVSVKDVSNNTTTISYDWLGHKTSMDDPDLGVWSYEYDPQGNLTKQTDARGQVLLFSYDNLNRLTKKYKDSVSGANELVSLSYGGTVGTNLGMLSQMEDESGTTTWTYSNHARTVTEKRTISSSDYSFTTVTDWLGRPITATYPDTEVVTYTYDDYGRAESVSGSVAGDLADLAYTAIGQIETMTLENGIVIDNTYHADNFRLTDRVAQKSGSDAIIDFDYGYDSNGNITSLDDNANGDEFTYEYDHLNRLTQADEDPTEGIAYSQTFEFDRVGNITQTTEWLEDVIFTEDFESDFSEWTESPGSGHPSLSTDAEYYDSKGLLAQSDDTSSEARFVKDASPADEQRYRARFYFDPNNVTMTLNDSHTIFDGLQGLNRRFVVEMRYANDGQNDVYQLRIGAWEDTAGAFEYGSWQTIDDDWHTIEIDWQRASAIGVSDGTMNFSLDGDAVTSLTALDNGKQAISDVRMGLVEGVDTATDGDLYFDEFEARRKTYIGLLAAEDLIFTDEFESGDLTAWASTATDSGDLTVDGINPKAGEYSISAFVDGTASMYAEDDTPSAETQYRARFYFDINALTMANNDEFVLFYGRDASNNKVFQIDVRYNSSQYEIRPQIWTDSSSTQGTWSAMTDVYHLIEVDWQASSGAGNDDGSITLWVDETQEDTITSVDNDTISLDHVRLGTVEGLDAGTSGTVFIDSFESRSSTYIGPVTLNFGQQVASFLNTSLAGVFSWFDRRNKADEQEEVIEAPAAARAYIPPPRPLSAEVFADGFEGGNLNAWDDTETDGGDLSATAGSAHTGDYGLAAIVDDTNDLYVQDETPSGKTEYRARFYFDPNGATIGASEDAPIFTASNLAWDPILFVKVGYFNGSYTISASAYEDDSGTVDTGNFNITDDWHVIEVSWEAASSADAEDGVLALWIDGSQKSSISSIDNFTKVVDTVAIGFPWDPDSSMSGTFYFDNFDSDDSTYIGPLPTATPTPTNTPTVTHTPTVTLTPTSASMPTLLSHWKMDEDSGTDVVDSAGDNDGTRSGPDQETTYSFEGAAALLFNDASDSVSISDDNSLEPSGSFSLTGWFYPTAANTSVIMINKGGGDADYGLRTDSDGFIEFRLDDLTPQIVSGPQLPTYTWSQVVGVYDDTADQILLYVNGILVASRDVTGSLSFNSTGLKFGDGSAAWQGRMDDVRLYDDALNQAQVTTLYRLFPTPTPTSAAPTPTNTNTPTITPTFTLTPTSTASPTATPVSSALFEDDFDSGDLSAWDYSTTDSGDLSAAAAAAIEGSHGLSAVIDDTTAIYVHDYTPTNADSYNARFYIDPNEIDIPNWDEFNILRDEDWRFGLNLAWSDEEYHLIPWVYDDSSTEDDAYWQIPISDQWHAVEVAWVASSGAGNDDGSYTIYVDGVERYSFTSIDNDTHDIDGVLFGAVGTPPTNTSGTVYFDEFFSTEATYIGFDADLIPEEIFADDFDNGNLNAWTSSSTDGGDLSASSSASFDGGFGMAALIDDTNSMNVYDRRPTMETRYRARFYLDPNSVTMSNWTEFNIFRDEDWNFGFDLGYTGSVYHIIPWVYDDDSNDTDAYWEIPLTDGWNTVEIDWKAASSAGADDGHYIIFIDGVQAYSFTDIDNDTHDIEGVYLGVPGGVSSGTSGTVYFDEFVSQRESYIGLLNGGLITPTPTPTPNSSVLFEDDFNSGDLNAWDSSSTDSGDLSASASALIEGSYGMAALIDDTNAIYVQDDTPNSETAYNARFYLDPNEVDLPDWDEFNILRDADWRFGINLAWSDEEYHIIPWVYDDSSTEDDAYWEIPISDQWHAIEVEWEASSGPGNDDGSYTIYVDGKQRYTFTGIDNDTHDIDGVRFGAPGTPPSGTTGTVYFDEFISTSGTYIGYDASLIPEGIFSDDFETNDLDEWTSKSTDSGDLSTSGSAAYDGSYGMAALIDDTNSMNVYDQRPTLETRYRARFYLDPNGVTIPNWDEFDIFRDYDWNFGLNLAYDGTDYYITPWVDNDSSSTSDLYWEIKISDAWHAIEIDWQASSEAGNDDGHYTIYVDGSQVHSFTNIDNDTHTIEGVYLGVPGGTPSSTSGTIYFDEFVSQRETYIGEISGGSPVISLLPTPEAADPDTVTHTYSYSASHPHAVSQVVRNAGELTEYTDTYTYDANGNMTQRIENGTTWTHTYNEENRLETVSDGADTWTFVYDGKGTRVKQVNPDSTTTLFLGGGLYTVEDATGTPVVTKYYSIAGQRVAMREGPDTSFLITDHLGSVVAVTDDTGALVTNSQQRYTAFGSTLHNLDSPTDFGFTGQRSLAAIGLSDYNARWYSPTLGRFTQADTIVPNLFRPQSLNRYAYVENNPINMIDPSGHGACWQNDRDCGHGLDRPKKAKKSDPPAEVTPEEPRKLTVCERNPRKCELGDWEVKLLALTIYTETQNGVWDEDLQEIIGWTYLNRLSVAGEFYDDLWEASKGRNSAVSCMYDTNQSRMDECNKTEDQLIQFNPGESPEEWVLRATDVILNGDLAGNLENSIRIAQSISDDWSTHGSFSFADAAGGLTDFAIATPEQRWSDDYSVQNNYATQDWRVGGGGGWGPGYDYEYVFFNEPTLASAGDNGDRFMIVNNKSLFTPGFDPANDPP